MLANTDSLWGIAQNLGLPTVRKDVLCILVHECINQNLSRHETSLLLRFQANIEPLYTDLVWNELESREPEKFTQHYESLHHRAPLTTAEFERAAFAVSSVNLHRLPYSLRGRRHKLQCIPHNGGRARLASV
ncbi:hypothetical protein CYMTET_19690 [Cymbomonas tetramitiformis]|uniref:Uncharacterized protein n=1 Tax=Cymbomonas tetramitiformis TaxID=36881 RepID=A0AAE0L515_9CHLO|nr:hypothetical protein CYMTET_19690 [Cymbomonas tetramitiformis]